MITSVSNVIITLLPLETKASMVSFLQLIFYVTTSTSADNNINGSIRLKTQFLLIEKSLKHFFNKV